MNQQTHIDLGRDHLPAVDTTRGFLARYPRFFETSITDVIGRRLEYRYQAMIERHRDALQGAVVLDLASHDGRWSFAALEAGARFVLGIEGRPEFVAKAEENLAYYGVDRDRYHFMAGDCLERLRQLPSGSFDTIFCFGFLYHTLSHFEILREICRIGASKVVVDTKLHDVDAAIIALAIDDTRLEGAAIPAGGSDTALVGVPSRRAMDLMFDHLGSDVSYVDWTEVVDGDDWSGVSDYQNRRRFTFSATPRAPRPGDAYATLRAWLDGGAP